MQPPGSVLGLKFAEVHARSLVPTHIFERVGEGEGQGVYLAHIKARKSATYSAGPRGSARWLSLAEVVNPSWLGHQHLGCQGHWCQPCSWAFCGERHLHLNDGDSSLRSQLSGWGGGSLIPSPGGQGPYQVAAAPHTAPTPAQVKKMQNSGGPAVSLSLSLPHPTRWLHSCRLAPSLSGYSSLLYPGKGGQLKSEVRVRVGPCHSAVPHRGFLTRLPSAMI